MEERQGLNRSLGLRWCMVGFFLYVGTMKSKQRRGALCCTIAFSMTLHTYSRAHTDTLPLPPPRRGPSLKIHSVNNDPSPSQPLLGASIATSSHTASLFLALLLHPSLSEPHITHAHTHTHTPNSLISPCVHTPPRPLGLKAREST